MPANLTQTRKAFEHCLTEKIVVFYMFSFCRVYKSGRGEQAHDTQCHHAQAFLFSRPPARCGTPRRSSGSLRLKLRWLQDSGEVAARKELRPF